MKKNITFRTNSKLLTENFKVGPNGVNANIIKNQEEITIQAEKMFISIPGAQLGAVPGLGAGPFHRSVAAIFPNQPVLSHCRPDRQVLRKLGSAWGKEADCVQF